MSDQDYDSKTEEPTPKRRSEFREKGNIPLSLEIQSVVALVVGFGVLYMTSSWFLEAYFNIFEAVSDGLGRPENYLNRDFLRAIVYEIAKVLALPFLFLSVATLLTGFIQTGVNFTLKPMIPSGEKFDPISKIKEKFFSLTMLVETAKGLSKLTVILGVVYLAIRDDYMKFLRLSQMSMSEALTEYISLLLSVLFPLICALICVALLDYLYKRFDIHRKMKMTKQEVKEGMREQEGDPFVKGKRRAMMKEFSKQRMMQSVPESTVVVTNPTHFAIAIRYTLGKDSAPTVVAKGKNLIAARIKDIARDNGVPVIENKSLARLLYKTVDINQEVPAALYQVVAKVLAIVYREKQNLFH